MCVCVCIYKQTKSSDSDYQTHSSSTLFFVTFITGITEFLKVTWN